MRFSTFFYVLFLTVVLGVNSIVNASFIEALPLPNSTPLKSVQEIADDWDGSRAWMTQGRALLFDTETTGVTAYDRIVQISIYELVNGKFTGNTFNSYINPCRSVSARAYTAHGLKKEFLKTQPKFADIFDSLRYFCGEKPLFVAHNAPFDIRMLNQEIERLDTINPWTVYFKCTLGMVRRDYKRSKNPNLNVISPLKQTTFRSISYYVRQKIIREKEALKIQKLWERDRKYGKKVQSSSQEDRDERAKKRANLKRTHDDMENQENVSPNNQTSDTDQHKSKKKRISPYPSLALSTFVKEQVDKTVQETLEEHGHSLSDLYKKHDIPVKRQIPHDAFTDVGMLVTVTDYLSSSSESSQPPSQEIVEGDEAESFSIFNDEEEDLDIFLVDDNNEKENEPFVIYSNF